MEISQVCGICGDVVDTHEEHIEIEGSFRGVDGKHLFHGKCWTKMEKHIGYEQS